MDFDTIHRLRKAKDLADLHYGRSLNLDVLAHEAHMSKYHFVRCFAQTYGETPIRYLCRRRIERAQDILRNQTMPVAEVAFAVGFASVGSFGSRFTELVGKSPRQYRQLWDQQKGSLVPACFMFMSGIDVRGGPS